MERRKFIIKSSMAASAVLLSGYTSVFAADSNFPTVRVAAKKRKFSSKAVERVINEVKSGISNKELAWMFENCFPNTLDTTVDFSMVDGKPDTYVITGDIDAMWLRDSSAQVWPYLPLCKEDGQLQQLIAGVINRQVRCILKDPYANAFYKDDNKQSDWKSDITDMQRGIHERKWEIDSLCYPIRLSYGYWKATGDTKVLDKQWADAMQLIVKTFQEQQRFGGNKGPYSFMRRTEFATDSVPMGGYGYPAKPNGLICSMFRPSDDATVYPYLIPSNFFALESLKQMDEMLTATGYKKEYGPLNDIVSALHKTLIVQAVVPTRHSGDIYAYEINGFGSANLMDDANVPSLLSMGYLIPSMLNDKTYENTRKFVLSANNPFFFAGKAGEGVGGPHVGMDQIWPMSIIMRGLTSKDEGEIKDCIKLLISCHAGTGFMHESFHKDDPKKFTRSWFAWANTLFGEFIWKVYRENPKLLDV
ncbi:MAG: glycoside hydrolase family 125 protein [Taibaiella sp.]|nr:glycoside hydrolase family 125 protein [Taibaiella sp.]